MIEHIFPVLHLGAIAFTMALAFSGFMIHAGVGDIPNGRSNHSDVTPTSGGIGLVAAMAAIILGAVLFYPQIELSPVLPGLLACAAMAAFIGLWDDVFAGHAVLKFLLTTGLGAAAVYLIGPPEALPFGAADIRLPYGVSFAGAVLWIFVITNGVNFMDGANGLMGSFMFIASLALMMFALKLGAMTTALLAGGLTFGLLGFLPYNFKTKALIFSGDVGSLLTGFVFAISCLLLVQEAPDFRTLYIGPLLMLPFLADILMTMCRRLRSGENLLTPHSSHLYQHLIRSGWSHQKVSLVYGALALLCANIAVFALAAGVIVSLWSLLLLALIAGVIKVWAQSRIN